MSDSDFDLLADQGMKVVKAKKPAEGYFNLECNLNTKGVHKKLTGTVSLGKEKFQNDGYETVIEAATKHYLDQIEAGVAHEDVKKFYIPLRAEVFVPAVMQQDKGADSLTAEQLLAMQETA